MCLAPDQHTLRIDKTFINFIASSKPVTGVELTMINLCKKQTLKESLGFKINRFLRGTHTGLYKD
jgi:hypothetical protein